MSNDWTTTKYSLICTDSGYKLRHLTARCVCGAEQGEMYLVDDKGQLTTAGAAAQSHVGKISPQLVDVTEELRIAWDAMQNRSEPNAYEERQEERRDRYRDRADRARTEGAAAHKRAHDMLDVIPLGQPILVGHHSERGHRSRLAKADGLFRKAFVECADKASHYENKADGVGRGGISGDDPDAIFKLTRKLQGCIESQELMKASNKMIRKHKTPEAQLSALIALGHSEKNAAELVKGDFCGRIGFASYALSNNNAEISRLKTRIDQIKKAKANETEDSREEHENYVYEVSKEENRLMFIFDGKPADEVRTILKSNAFKWSPRRGAWVRQITPNAKYAAELVKRQLAQI